MINNIIENYIELEDLLKENPARIDEVIIEISSATNYFEEVVDAIKKHKNNEVYNEEVEKSIEKMKDFNEEESLIDLNNLKTFLKEKEKEPFYKELSSIVIIGLDFSSRMNKLLTNNKHTKIYKAIDDLMLYIKKTDLEVLKEIIKYFKNQDYYYENFEKLFNISDDIVIEEKYVSSKDFIHELPFFVIYKVTGSNNFYFKVKCEYDSWEATYIDWDFKIVEPKEVTVIEWVPVKN